jgi:hypothetical protein
MIKGTFDEFSLLDIIQLILTTKKTGVLYVGGPEGTGSISFSNGEICAAGSTFASEPLGRRLVRRGDLGEGDLRAALRRLEGTNDRLGESLVAAGVVRRDAVRSALEEQVHDGLLDVLRLRPTEFRWEHDDPTPVAAPRTDQLLDAVTQRLSQLERITQRYVDGAAVTLSPVPEGSPPEIRLSLEEWRMISLLGTRRTLSDVLRYSQCGDTRASRVLHRLIEEGLVEVLTVAGRRAHDARDPGVAEVISLNRDDSEWIGNGRDITS